MNKKTIVNILIVGAIIAVIALLAVLTFVDFDALKKKEFTIKYEATVGGQIDGQLQQTIEEGQSGKTVTAIPDEGYRFLKWSDTCNPNPTRTETEVTDDISAKAIFLKISEIKYEILLIYVTEVQATFKALDGTEVVADYKMDERDLRLCSMITTQFEIYLNEMFDGLVTFVVDEYYTHEVMREENFQRDVAGASVDFDIFAENIPEVADMLDNYENYITTCYLADPEGRLNVSAGVANYKTANIHLREHIGPFQGESEEMDRKEILLGSFGSYRLKGGTYTNRWNDLMATYLHEFAHTVEAGFHFAPEALYHYILYGEYKAVTSLDTLNVTRLYLLNQAQYQGKTVGIPFPAWTKEVYTLNFLVNDDTMGYIEGAQLPNGMPLRVAKGYDSGTITAIPLRHYRFVKWSDGVTTATHNETNVQGDITVTATFEPKTFYVTYTASEGGRIVGMTNQQCLGAAAFESVTAVANEGYRFVGWSDGKLDERRQDSTYGIAVNRFDENDSLEITAIFEPI